MEPEDQHHILSKINELKTSNSVTTNNEAPRTVGSSEDTLSLRSNGDTISVRSTSSVDCWNETVVTSTRMKKADIGDGESSRSRYKCC